MHVYLKVNFQLPTIQIENHTNGDIGGSFQRTQWKFLYRWV